MEFQPVLPIGTGCGFSYNDINKPAGAILGYVITYKRKKGGNGIGEEKDSCKKMEWEGCKKDQK